MWEEVRLLIQESEPGKQAGSPWGPPQTKGLSSTVVGEEGSSWQHAVQVAAGHTFAAQEPSQQQRSQL